MRQPQSFRNGTTGKMATVHVRTAHASYPNLIERGALRSVSEFIPRRTSKVFIITTEDVWTLHGGSLKEGINAEPTVLFFPGGEQNKRLSAVEKLADEMLAAGGDRGSVVIGFGGGIVTDVSGFLAAIFMRGVPILQVPTTLLAQVDAATGGKTGVNLAGGKNLIGSFHQPIAVLIDADVLSTLPAREYRAGLFEIIKCGIIRDPALFELFAEQSGAVLAQAEDLLDRLIYDAVRIKADVVSADEREGDLRRILNFGHTVGHAMEAETGYTRYLHGEAVAWGMLAATRLANRIGMLPDREAGRIHEVICRYGPLPSGRDLNPDALVARLASDKKTVQGRVHFVLPAAIGEVKMVDDAATADVRGAIVETLQ